MPITPLQTQNNPNPNAPNQLLPPNGNQANSGINQSITPIADQVLGNIQNNPNDPNITGINGVGQPTPESPIPNDQGNTTDTTTGTTATDPPKPGIEFASYIDYTGNYWYENVEVEIIGQKFYLGDGLLQNVVITLGANEKSSTVEITLNDYNLKITDVLFTKSRAAGGIKLPAELGSSSTTTGNAGGTTGGTSGSSGGTVDVSNIPDGLTGDDLAKVIYNYCKSGTFQDAPVGITINAQIAYILATAQHESNMGETLSEIGGESASYAPYYGRGLVQITHESNYKDWGDRLGIDLVGNPDLALQLKYAVPILCIGMRDGTFTGVKLSDYITESSQDFEGARAIVNGSDRASLIAGYAQDWLTKIASYSAYSAQTLTPTLPNDGSLSMQIPSVLPPSSGISDALGFPGSQNSYPSPLFPELPFDSGSDLPYPFNQTVQPFDPNQNTGLPNSQNPRQPTPGIPGGTGQIDPGLPDGYPIGVDPNLPDGSINPSQTPIDPNLPQPTDPTTPNTGTDPNNPTIPTQTTTQVTATTGEKIYVNLRTNENTYKYTFIWTGDQVEDISNATLTINGKAARYQLELTEKSDNLEGLTPPEYFAVIARQYGFSILNQTKKSYNPINLITQRNTTDAQTMLQIANEYDISVIDDPASNSVVIKDKDETTTPKKIVNVDIISISFSDEGVTDEKPLYPVDIELFTTSDILELKPEDSISLDSVYSIFLPESLRKDTWVINTISHNVVEESTKINLLKYIPKPKVGTAGGGGKVSLSELHSKYDNAIFKLSAPSEQGVATGWFVTSDGWAMTAGHMEDHNGKVVLKDGTEKTCSKKQVDHDRDLMVIFVDGVTNATFIPIAPDVSCYTDKTDMTVYAIGMPSQKSGGQLYWNGSQSVVDAILPNGDNQGISKGETVQAVDDSTATSENNSSQGFVDHGNSGCPWFDSWGLAVSLTSGGTENDVGAVNPGDKAWGASCKEIMDILKTAGCSTFTVGQRITKIDTGTGTGTGGAASGTSEQKILDAINSLGDFSTSDFSDPRNACAYAINKVVQTAGYATIGDNPNYVPSVREALQGGRGKLIDRANVTGGLIAIARGCYHIGITIDGSTIKSNSSSAAAYKWQSNLDFDGTYDSDSVDGYNESSEFWEVVS